MPRSSEPARIEGALHRLDGDARGVEPPVEQGRSALGAITRSRFRRSRISASSSSWLEIGLNSSVMVVSSLFPPARASSSSRTPPLPGLRRDLPRAAGVNEGSHPPGWLDSRLSGPWGRVVGAAGLEPARVSPRAPGARAPALTPRPDVVDWACLMVPPWARLGVLEPSFFIR